MKVILLILAAFFLVGIVRVGLFVLRIRKQMKQFTQNMRQQQQQQQQDSGYGQSTTTHTQDGVTIIDRRDPDERNKKIFTKDEGEYVDYTET